MKLNEIRNDGDDINDGTLQKVLKGQVEGRRKR
jgi:hypothetical protein